MPLGMDAYDELVRQMVGRGGAAPDMGEQAFGRQALMNQTMGGRRGRRKGPQTIYSLGSSMGGLAKLARGGPISKMYRHELKGPPHPSLMAKNPMMPHTWDDYLEDDNLAYMRGGAG